MYYCTLTMMIEFARQEGRLEDLPLKEPIEPDSQSQVAKDLFEIRHWVYLDSAGAARQLMHSIVSLE